MSVALTARPAHWTRVSRQEDRTICGDSFVLINSIQARALRDQRCTRIVALPLPLQGVLHDSGSSMKHLALLLASFALCSATLEAQSSSSSSVPESHRPPPGMCRIWIDGVPPTHQPAPTDCATAIRKRPMNARVVFGSEAPASGARNFAPAPRVQSNFAPQTAVPSAPSHDEQNRAAQQQREEQEHQRILQQQRDAQERARVDAQRQHEEQQKREPAHAPPPTQHDQERAAPQQRPRTEKAQRPPQQSHSRRPR